MSKPPITERDRRTPEQRAADMRDQLNKSKELREANAALVKSKSLRFAMERMQRAWDQGYACAVDMLARLHADGVPTEEILENLRGRVRHPQAVPLLARGTRSMEPMSANSDTAPASTEADTAPITVDDEVG